MENKIHFGRRNFLKKSTLALFGTGKAASRGWPLREEAEEKPSLKIKEYRLLGRTGFWVSDIGGGYIQDEGLIRGMLDAGVRYFDSAESYPGHHRLIARAIKGYDRKSFFLTSKMEVKEDPSREGFMRRARKCLEELETEYLDCMMMHMPEKLETLKTEGFHEAMKELKAEGRIRFVGVSHHGSFWFQAPEVTMEKTLLAAAEDGRFDVFLMAYNFLQMDQGEQVLEVCKEKKIGVALMKTKPVNSYYNLKSRIEKLEKEGKEIHPLYQEGLKRFKEQTDKAEYFVEKYNLKNPEEIREAAVRFVLSNPDINTVCCSAQNYDELERYVRLSGTRLSALEKEKLAAYRQGCGLLYCRHACGCCEPQCPHHVPVNTIMRFNHYFEAQGREKEAMDKYAAIPGANAGLCQSCPGYCETACPYNVPIQGMLILAHHELTLA